MKKLNEVEIEKFKNNYFKIFDKNVYTLKEGFLWIDGNIVQPYVIWLRRGNITDFYDVSDFIAILVKAHNDLCKIQQYYNTKNFELTPTIIKLWCSNNKQENQLIKNILNQLEYLK